MTAEVWEGSDLEFGVFDVGNQTYEIEEYLEIKVKIFSKPVVRRFEPAFLGPIGKSLLVRLVNFRFYEKATEIWK